VRRRATKPAIDGYDTGRGECDYDLGRDRVAGPDSRNNRPVEQRQRVFLGKPRKSFRDRHTAPAYTAGQVTEEIVEESGDATLRSLDTIKQVSLRSDGSIFISCAAEAMSFCQAK